MKEERQNKMAIAPMNKLILKMGLPMIISMILQALYNVIDSIFVANMGTKGAIANQALTYAFPIQIMIIAIGVGTGVGLNALLSNSLGENDRKKVNKIAGNGIFLSICIFIIDKSAKDMLGTDAYLLNSFIDDINMDDIKVNIGEKINEIYKAKDKIIKLYNDNKNKT